MYFLRGNYMQLIKSASMPKRLLAVAIVVAAASLGAALAPHHETLCEGFLPKNNMKIPVGANATNSPYFKSRPKRPPVGMPAPAPSAGGLTEQQFNDVMDRIEKLNAPIVAQAGGTLSINRKWNDATVNASAEQFGSSWILNMYGGLARHPEVTVEGMALVACHELGHHLGGAPKISGVFGGDNWATNEGGADYYATLKCLRNYFAEDDNQTIIASADIDPVISNGCLKQFSDKADQLICERISMAGQSVAYLFMDLSKDAKPSWSTPDPSVVTQMDDEHPATQCRMDTYLAGDLCHVDKSVPNSKTDYKEGSCVQGVDDVGFRPRCWFKPAD